MPTISEVLAAMHRIECAQDKPDGSVPDPYGEVMARLLGMEHSDAFDQALMLEAARSVTILTEQARDYHFPRSWNNLAAIAFVQGATFAVAALRLNAPLAEES